MNKVLACLCVVLLGAALGQVQVRGILNAGAQTTTIDSAHFNYGGSQRWHNTAGWEAPPAGYDTFDFNAGPNWPNAIRLAANDAGMPFELIIPNVRPDTWYQFEPPLEQSRVLFTELTGIEEGRGAAVRPVGACPSILRSAVTLSAAGPGTLEVVDAAGRVVRSFAAPASVVWRGDDASGRRLAAGVYYCRLAGTGSGTRVIIAR